MVKINKLIDLCTQWSSDRGIFVNGTLQTQALKLVSEIG